MTVVKPQKIQAVAQLGAPDCQHFCCTVASHHPDGIAQAQHQRFIHRALLRQPVAVEIQATVQQGGGNKIAAGDVTLAGRFGMARKGPVSAKPMRHNLPQKAIREYPADRIGRDAPFGKKCDFTAKYAKSTKYMF